MFCSRNEEFPCANGYGVQIVPESIRAVSMPGLVYRPIQAKGDSSIVLQCAYRRDETSVVLAALLVIIREFCRSWGNTDREVVPKKRAARVSLTKVISS